MQNNNINSDNTDASNVNFGIVSETAPEIGNSPQTGPIKKIGSINGADPRGKADYLGYKRVYPGKETFSATYSVSDDAFLTLTPDVIEDKIVMYNKKGVAVMSLRGTGADYNFYLAPYLNDAYFPDNQFYLGIIPGENTVYNINVYASDGYYFSSPGKPRSKF